MKRKQTGRTSLPIPWGFTLAIVAVASPGDVQGQMRTPDVRQQQEFALGALVDLAVPVRLVEDVDLLTRLKWTLQVLFVPRSIDDINPLYAYELESVEGQEIHSQRVGPVAMVGQCSPSPPSLRGHADDAQQSPTAAAQFQSIATTWCAQYFGDVTAAYDAAHAADAADGDYYFATTYPLANVEPAQRFVSEYGHASYDYYRWVDSVPEGDR